MHMYMEPYQVMEILRPSLVPKSPSGAYCLFNLQSLDSEQSAAKDAAAAGSLVAAADSGTMLLRVAIYNPFVLSGILPG